MVLIKEITIKNCTQFTGMPASILVVEHKKGERKMRHMYYLMGIVVCQHGNDGGKYFYIQFSTGGVTGSYPTVSAMLKAEAEYFSFYYIEIKKQQ